MDCIRAAARLGWLLLALLLLPASAQIVGRSAAAASAPTAPLLRDPLDRSTPRRAIAAFARAAQRGDLGLAARYAQAGGRPPARAETLAGELGELMDRQFHQSLAAISDAPEGDLADGLPPDRERIGPLSAGGEAQFIELVRVADRDAGPVWLISSETMGRIAVLRDQAGRSWPEQVLPAALFVPAIFNFTFADLVVWLASLLLPLLLLPPLSRLGRLVMRKVLYGRTEAVDAWYRATRGPLIALLTLSMHLYALSWFGPTLSFRIRYSQWIAVLLVAVLAWGVHRASSVLFGRAGAHLQDRGHTGVRTVMMLGERLLNVVIVLVALLLVLAVIGFEIKTVLAGLGIVGIALALGAQKTIENILGGMMLLGDEALAVGDLCRINNRHLTVEDITLRSVRFRTMEQTLLSIPAGVLAQAEIENFATRGRILARHRLRLAYGTSAQQLRRIREELAALLEADARLEHPLSRVRLVEFGLVGIELEIFAYVLTQDVPEFLAIQEDLLLAAAGLVEAAGARFAENAGWAAALPPAPADPAR